jgi:hypothetical protein
VDDDDCDDCDAIENECHERGMQYLNEKTGEEIEVLGHDTDLLYVFWKFPAMFGNRNTLFGIEGLLVCWNTQIVDAQSQMPLSQCEQTKMLLTIEWVTRDDKNKREGKVRGLGLFSECILHIFSHTLS